MSFKTIDKTVPCYGCEKRHNGCHSSCAGYKTYQDKRIAKNKIIREGRAKEGMIDEVRLAAIQKVTGKKRTMPAWKG